MSDVTPNEEKYLIDRWARESRDLRSSFRAMTRDQLAETLLASGVREELVDEIYDRLRT